MLVQQHKLGIEAGFDGKLAQQAHTETVDRRDDRAVERAFVAHPPRALTATRVLEQTIKRFAQTLAHFVGGTIGESNSYDLIDRGGLLFTKDVKIPFDQHRGLTRSGACGDGDVPVKRMCCADLAWF